MDRAEVLAASRLGWLMVEVRGRYEAGLEGDTVRTHFILPLQPERSPKERVIEVEKTLKVIATKLGVDGATNGAGGKLKAVVGQLSKADKLTQLGTAVLDANKEEGAKKTACTSLAKFLFEWDTSIQDTFAYGNTSIADAYQLGKGFAEIRWMLNAASVDLADHRSWPFLLGQERVDDLTRLLRRQLPYYDGLTIHALAASLWAWGQVAANPQFRQAADVPMALERQSVNWHDLLMTDLSAGALLTPEDVIKNIGDWFVVLRKFWGLALISAIGLVVAAVGVFFFTTHPDTVSKIGGALAAALGLFGISAAGIQARLKTTANGLLDQLREALYQDLVAAAATVLPNEAARKINRRARGRDLKWRAAPPMMP